MATQKLASVYSRLEQDAIPLSWQALYEEFPDVEAQLDAQAQFFVALEGLTNLPELSHEDSEMLPGEGYAQLPEIGSDIPPAMIAAMDARVRDAGPILDAIRQAVAQEPFWLVAPRHAFDFPQSCRLTSVLQTARLFRMSAILHSEAADSEAATEAVLDGLRLAGVLRRGSMLIDELVRIACEGIALRSLEHVLAKTDPSASSLEALKHAMSAHHGMRMGFLGEIVYANQNYEGMSGISRSDMQMMISFSAPHPLRRLLTYLPISSGWIRMNAAYHLELLHHAVDTWDLPWHDFTDHYARASDALPWLYFLPDLSKDAYSGAKHRELIAAGAWCCGQIAIAIKRYAQTHGALPGSLTELVPTFLEVLPTEPFYGHPFDYTNDGETGTLRFVYPDSGKDYTFKVFAGTGAVHGAGIVAGRHTDENAEAEK